MDFKLARGTMETHLFREASKSFASVALAEDAV
jgi:hypothetical protein